ncbi:WD40/YVTN/BNR-like repeat-containing protein [Pseudomonas chlororaphis]|uniref:BNR repeat-containing glycosyl hydrolase n=1 Tax=Pseudomonas chlororaphis TaxID=587753 RepID=A0AAX3FM05_9PSED|nr:YCF48-related protein [Pseudomonas chlororaphis]AZC37258.1 BNR/Asp-box repeat protein [Pseudomonas chlororaphis subsp. piscium]AZC43805.1 BNR/Asp-box repeat protein [Pseudomonas chlororaphis subsp. piscium]WDG75664.1 YCF48-related protein [Pseudomonas chlororaphis]WDH26701.1 YCF48-related protein [Pseudomonas chlororaphis]WDH74182.1 YCF48-related protein [Pseudomonas chlororaphis]
MSEPVMGVSSCRPPALRRFALLATALSLLGVALLPAPVQAAASAADTVYSTESAKASKGLMLDVVHAGSRLVAVGDRGHILYSDDQGQTWTQAKVPTRQLLTAVYFVDAKHGWAVGHDAQVLASEDGGLTWTKQFEDLKREAPLLDVWFQDTNNGFAVGAYGALLATTDGGKHWEDASDRLDNEDQYHLNAIAAVKGSGLFIVGEQGSMFRSADWGQTWERLEGPYEGSFFGVIGTAQPATLLAYGLRGNLYRSTDFGSTWEQVELKAARGSLEFGLSGATLLDDGSLVIVGNGGSVVRSTDNGLTFSVYNRPDRISLAAVTAAGNGNLILAGQGGVRSTSSNGADLGK